MIQQQHSGSVTTNNPRRSIAAALVFFLVTCGSVLAAAADDPDNNRKRRTRKPANNVSPATDVSVDKCSGLKRKKCNRDPKCEFMDDGECMPKPTRTSPVQDDGGEDSVEDPNLLVGMDPCAQKSKTKCKKAKVCRYKRNKDICQSRRRKKNAVAGDADLKGTNNISIDPTKTKPCPVNHCSSPDGGCVPLVNCFMDPCEMDPCSSTEICMPNYCGGCNHVCLPRQSDPRPIAIGDSEPFQLPEGACIVGGEDCPAGSFCRLKPGTCLTTPDVHVGMCEVKSGICNKMHDPVCGCDGETYTNSCVADTAGVSISGRGKCVDNEPIQADDQKNDPLSCAVGSASATAGLNMDPCPTNTFCKLDMGACLTKTEVLFGLCAPRSDICMEMYDPVCGCDGRTYGSACSAETAGVSISGLGECTKPNITIIKDANQGDLSTDPSFEVLDTDPIIEVFKCGSQETCSEAGTTCTVGSETCCGVTHDSMECTCESGDDGRLQYQCKYTDRCMIPSCCQSGPPADMPPPAYGTCAIGELCDTGIADDYCCYDQLGGAGTYCSKSGGKE
mmetsp:Transcript_30255/g.55767  ORF Transcript_30255/g.55767 Transcript_30255/m.55767 type:complete len:560 (+) Transcript_30255:126-1805(+)